MPRRCRRGRKANRDRKDLGVVAETEMETLDRLKRQYLKLLRELHAYRIKREAALRRQEQEISVLREEQEELLRGLGRQLHDDTESIQTLLEQRNTLDAQLENERQTQKQLGQEIINMEKKLMEARRGEASQSQMSQARHTQKATRRTQDTLERAVIRFDEQMTKNSQLREKIETLRMQRARFQQLYGKLDKVLQDVRKDIGKVFYMSTKALNAGEETRTKITMMKEKAEKDFAQYSAEMRELQRVTALEEFMTTENEKRSAMDFGQEMRRRQEMKEQRRAEAREETSDTLEEVFQQIIRLTGEDNLEKLVTKLIEDEDKNFTLFKFVKEQTIEAEKLREQIHTVREEMQQLHMEGVQKERENQVALKGVMDHLAVTQTQQYEAQADDISKILDQMKTCLDRVFNKIDRDQTLVQDMLGSSSGIKNSNIMTYLSLLELKTSEMLTVQTVIQSKGLEEVPQFLPVQKPDEQRDEAIVQPSITRHDFKAEDSSLINEADRPLTHKEIHQHMMSSVVGKDESLRTGGGKYVKNP